MQTCQLRVILKLDATQYDAFVDAIGQVRYKTNAVSCDLFTYMFSHVSTRSLFEQ